MTDEEKKRYYDWMLDYLMDIDTAALHAYTHTATLEELDNDLTTIRDLTRWMIDTCKLLKESD